MIIYSTISVNLFAKKASSHFISIGREQHNMSFVERCGESEEMSAATEEAERSSGLRSRVLRGKGGEV